GGGLPDCVACHLAGLERRIIEDRVNLDEAPQFALFRRLAGYQFAPRKITGLAGQESIERCRRLVEHAGERRKPRLAAWLRALLHTLLRALLRALQPE